jgi:hypothetical protein
MSQGMMKVESIAQCSLSISWSASLRGGKGGDYHGRWREVKHTAVWVVIVSKGGGGSRLVRRIRGWGSWVNPWTSM